MISIQSHRHVYTVDFVEDYAKRLQAVARPGDCAIVDKNVGAAHPQVLSALAGVRIIHLDATETAKEFRAMAPVIESICSTTFTKSDRLIAIGGGITQDITAFIASILYRGTPWIFFPTTLLAQCDSCIGSKTSINFGAAKNQLGTFYPPSEIHISSSFLKSLGDSEIMSGIGEMLHYALVSSEEDFAQIESSVEEAASGGPALAALVDQSLGIKARMIEVDEFDKGPRNVFNYGHSFGHAIESATDFAVPHGIAVSYGMDLANILAADRGWITMALRNRIQKTLSKVWANCALPASFDIARFQEALRHDKKNTGSTRNVILSRGIGQMEKTPLGDDQATENRMEAFFATSLYRGEL